MPSLRVRLKTRETIADGGTDDGQELSSVVQVGEGVAPQELNSFMEPVIRSHALYIMHWPIVVGLTDCSPDIDIVVVAPVLVAIEVVVADVVAVVGCVAA